MVGGGGAGGSLGANGPEGGGGGGGGGIVTGSLTVYAGVTYTAVSGAGGARYYQGKDGGMSYFAWPSANPAGVAGAIVAGGGGGGGGIGIPGTLAPGFEPWGQIGWQFGRPGTGYNGGGGGVCMYINNTFLKPGNGIGPAGGNGSLGPYQTISYSGGGGGGGADVTPFTGAIGGASRNASGRTGGAGSYSWLQMVDSSGSDRNVFGFPPARPGRDPGAFAADVGVGGGGGAGSGPPLVYGLGGPAGGGNGGYPTKGPAPLGGTYGDNGSVHGAGGGGSATTPIGGGGNGAGGFVQWSW